MPAQQVKCYECGKWYLMTSVQILSEETTFDGLVIYRFLCICGKESQSPAFGRTTPPAR
jgi:hypothetical protein